MPNSAYFRTPPAETGPFKPAEWIGTALRDLRALPDEPRRNDGTYRAIYTAKLADVVYVLHVFQKKSTRGIATPKHDVAVIRERWQRAKAHYAAHHHDREE